MKVEQKQQNLRECKRSKMALPVQYGRPFIDSTRMLPIVVRMSLPESFVQNVALLKTATVTR
jgi:hypothetical protein